MEHVAGGGAGIGFHLRNYQPTYSAFFFLLDEKKPDTELRNEITSEVLELRWLNAADREIRTLSLVLRSGRG